MAEPQTIRICIVGVGNCASACTFFASISSIKNESALHPPPTPLRAPPVLQGLAIATTAARPLSGVTFPSIGGYTPASITPVLSIDVDSRKVGRPLADAIFAAPNCCWPLCNPAERANLPRTAVLRGPTLDGVAPHMLCEGEAGFLESPAPPLTRAEAVAALRDSRVDVLINYLPVGSQLATEWWAEACLEAGVALLNCIPVFLASDPSWEAKFVAAGLPMIGDDMRSQFGASVLSQMLEELAYTRGHKVVAHIQQNSGGNTDFLNMTDAARLASKRTSKENVIKAPRLYMGGGGEASSGGFIYAGPSDYIAHLGDNKVATFRLELEGFGGAPVTLDARLSVQDSPNSAGVVVDAVRLCVACCVRGGAPRQPPRAPPPLTRACPPPLTHTLTHTHTHTSPSQPEGGARAGRVWRAARCICLHTKNAPRAAAASRGARRVRGARGPAPHGLHAAAARGARKVLHGVRAFFFRERRKNNHSYIIRLDTRMLPLLFFRATHPKPKRETEREKELHRGRSRRTFV